MDETSLVEDPNSTTELWSLIAVGDQIQLEADLQVNEELLLKRSTLYTVLAKTDQQGDAYFDAFIVQSELNGQLVPVSPAFVSDYTRAASAPHFV